MKYTKKLKTAYILTAIGPARGMRMEEKGRGIGWGEERGTEEKEVGGCERKENGKGKGCRSGGNETALI